MNGYVVGVDIGSAKICASAGMVDKKGNIKIIGISSVPCSSIKLGKIEDDPEVASILKNCIEQLEKMIDTKIDEVYISIPNNLCTLQENRGIHRIEAVDKEIRSSDVGKVIKNASCFKDNTHIQSISTIPIQYSIDGFENIKDPVGMCGSKLEVEADVITTTDNIVSSYVESFNKAGIKVKGILFQPIAESEITFTMEEKNEVSLIIDAGTEKIDLAVFEKGYILYISSIPLGGNSITKDISICLNVSSAEAERLKIKYNTLKKLDKDETINLKNSLDNSEEVNYNTLIDIMEARIEELFELIKENLVSGGYYDEIRSVILVGGGLALFKGTLDIGKNILNKPIRIGMPEYIGAASPLYACSVGIVNQVFSPSDKYFSTDIHKYNREDFVNENKKGSANKILLKIKEIFGGFF